MKWEPTIFKAELRLASQKIGQIQARYDSQAIITRADIATLIHQGNVPLARDKAEKLIQDEAFGDLLGELEMQLGLLLEHSRQLGHGPFNHIVKQAASSIVYATPYLHSKDLDVIRDYLVSSFGSDFAHSTVENPHHHVSSRILRSTSTPIPSAFKLDSYLQDIANAYGIDWLPEPQRQEIVNSLSELLDPNATTVVDLPQLQKLCSRGIPDEPSWLRPRIWKLFFGTLPMVKASWKPEMMTQREAYYDLVRQLLGPFSPLSQSSNSTLLDNTLRAAYKQLYGLPKDFYTMLEDEPESFSQCPLNEGGRDEAIALILESRLLILDGQSKYSSRPPPTPEIRLELHPMTPDSPTAGSDTVTAEGLPTSTTLIPSRKCMFGYAHPKHCSALLRLLYFHMTINPGNISPHLSSFLVPLYSVLMQEVDPEDLAHVEADTFWLFEAMLAELLGLEDDAGKVWMTKLSERLAWVDNDLFVHLQTIGLDPILPYYSYRWLMPMLTHTVPLSSAFLVWDAVFSCRARDKNSNPKLDLFLDVCASMIIRAKTALYRLGDVKQKGLSLWTANTDQLSYSTGPAAQAADALLEGVSLLQPFNLSNVGGIERVLQVASDLSQRRSRESVARHVNPSLRDRFRVNMWKELTSKGLPSNESPADNGNETDGSSESSAIFRNSSVVSQFTNTVWKGITNQAAMESPSTPPSPSVPLPIPQPKAEPETTQTTSKMWSYAEKLKGSNTIATISKMSSNWRARAFLGSFSSPKPTSIAGNQKDHPIPSSGSYENLDSPRTSSSSPLLTPALPLEADMEGSSQQSNKTLIEKTRSFLSPTHSPPLAPKAAPRPLLLSSTLLTSGQSSLKGHRNYSTTMPDPEEWADVMRGKQHHIYRDSLSSTSSLSPIDAYVRTPKSTKSDRESDTTSSRIISLNRRSISPMAPNFRSGHGRLQSRNSSTSSGFASPPILSRSPLQGSQTANARVASESPKILQTHPVPSDRNASRTATFDLKESDDSDTASNERPSSVMRLASSRPESEDSDLSIKASRVRSKRYPRLPNLEIQDGQKSRTSVEEDKISSQLTVEWPQDENEIASTPRGSRFESEEHVSMPRKLSKSPLRSKKLSTGDVEGQRKGSMDTIKDNRQRKVSNGHRARKISTESREVPKSRRDSSAEEGGDEGYDDLLSAYESEDGPQNSWVF